MPLHHLFPDVVDALVVDGVVRGLGSDRHGPGQVDARRDEGCQDAAHPLDDGRLQKAPATGSLSITESSHARPLVIAAARRSATTRDQDDRQRSPTTTC